MPWELMYTSAPEGLKPGSRGFCTVAMTQGLGINLVQRLENLSGYRPAFEPTDPRSAENPVNFASSRFALGGQEYFVLSRIAFAGFDYTQRTNKFAHHVALTRQELPPEGPAWLALQPGFLAPAWTGVPRLLTLGKAVPQPPRPHRPANLWKKIAGDAGWAGTLAQKFLDSPVTPVAVLYEPGCPVLELLDEAIALLPPEKRWDVTFSTYLTDQPGGVTYAWRCLLPDSPLWGEMKRNRKLFVLDLTSPQAGPPMAGRLADCARTGEDPWPPPDEPAFAKPEVAGPALSAPVEPVIDLSAFAVAKRPETAMHAVQIRAPQVLVLTDSKIPPGVQRRNRENRKWKLWLLWATTAVLVALSLIVGGAILAMRHKDTPASTRPSASENARPGGPASISTSVPEAKPQPHAGTLESGVKDNDSEGFKGKTPEKGESVERRPPSAGDSTSGASAVPSTQENTPSPPEDPPKRQWTNTFHQAQAEAKNGNLDEAVKLAKKSLEQGPDDKGKTDIREFMVGCLSQEASGLEQAGEYQEARTVYEELKGLRADNKTWQAKIDEMGRRINKFTIHLELKNGAEVVLPEAASRKFWISNADSRIEWNAKEKGHYSVAWKPEEGIANRQQVTFEVSGEKLKVSIKGGDSSAVDLDEELLQRVKDALKPEALPSAEVIMTLKADRDFTNKPSHTPGEFASLIFKLSESGHLEVRGEDDAFLGYVRLEWPDYQKAFEVRKAQILQAMEKECAKRSLDSEKFTKKKEELERAYDTFKTKKLGELNGKIKQAEEDIKRINKLNDNWKNEGGQNAVSHISEFGLTGLDTQAPRLDPEFKEKMKEISESTEWAVKKKKWNEQEQKQFKAAVFEALKCSEDKMKQLKTKKGKNERFKTMLAEKSPSDEDLWTGLKKPDTKQELGVPDELLDYPNILKKLSQVDRDIKALNARIEDVKNAKSPRASSPESSPDN